MINNATITGALRSNTMQFTAVVGAVWTAILTNQDLLEKYPELIAVLAAVQTIGSFLLRIKTTKSLEQR